MDVTFQRISNFERRHVELLTRAKNAIETAQQRSENTHRQAFEKIEIIGLEIYTNYAIVVFSEREWRLSADIFKINKGAHLGIIYTSKCSLIRFNWYFVMQFFPLM